MRAEELPQFFELRVDVGVDIAFLRQSPKNGFSEFRRRFEVGRKFVRCTALEGVAKSIPQTFDIEAPNVNEEDKVDQIFHTRVWLALALERVCVELLREVES